MCDRAGAVRAFDRDVAELVPVVETAAAFLEMIGGRHFGIVDFGRVGGLPVDAFSPLRYASVIMNSALLPPWVRPL